MSRSTSRRVGLALALGLAGALTTVPAGAALAAGDVAWMYDVNRDGAVDTSSVDSNRDGWLDGNNVDVDADGYGETWLIDANQDSVVDHAWRDSNRDGYVDVTVADTDQDGQFVAAPVRPGAYNGPAVGQSIVISAEPAGAGAQAAGPSGPAVGQPIVISPPPVSLADDTNWSQLCATDGFWCAQWAAGGGNGSMVSSPYLGGPNAGAGWDSLSGAEGAIAR